VNQSGRAVQRCRDNELCQARETYLHTKSAGKTKSQNNIVKQGRGKASSLGHDFTCCCTFVTDLLHLVHANEPVLTDSKRRIAVYRAYGLLADSYRSRGVILLISRPELSNPRASANLHKGKLAVTTRTLEPRFVSVQTVPNSAAGRLLQASAVGQSEEGSPR
jgi:hypothetical protein